MGGFGVIGEIKGLWFAEFRAQGSGFEAEREEKGKPVFRVKRLAELFGLVSDGCARGRRGTIFIVEKQFRYKGSAFRV
jgi:hypothetical protein